MLKFSENSSNQVKQKLKCHLGDLIKFGESRIPSDGTNLDIIFDMEFDNNTTEGFIECKLWGKSIGYSVLTKYYKKACERNCPFSFLVCKKIVNLKEIPLEQQDSKDEKESMISSSIDEAK